MATPRQPPTFSFAPSRQPFVSLERLIETARRAGLASIELDASARYCHRHPAAVARITGEASLAVTALWFDHRSPRFARRERDDRLTASVVELANSTGAASVVADAPTSDDPDKGRRLRLAHRLRVSLPPTSRLTLAFRPHQLLGTRAHLDGLVAVRHLAEEWDWDLALDLCGPIDPAWESEAAVSKLLPRLTIVRIGPLWSRPPGRGRAQQTKRILAFLADLGYHGVIAIQVARPVWPFEQADALAHLLFDNVEAVRARFDSTRQELWSDPIPEFRPHA